MKESRKPIIAVDMDEVIADALGEHLLRYNRDFATDITPADLHGQWLWEYVPAHRQKALEDYMLSERLLPRPWRDAGRAACYTASTEPLRGVHRHRSDGSSTQFHR